MVGKNFFHPFTPDSAKSKIDTFSKMANLVTLNNKLHHSKVLLNRFSMNGHTLKLSIESKVRILCITERFTLGVKGLTNSTTVKYWSTAFQ